MKVPRNEVLLGAFFMHRSYPEKHGHADHVGELEIKTDAIYKMI